MVGKCQIYHGVVRSLFEQLVKAYLGMVVVTSAMTYLVKQVVDKDLHYEDFVVVYEQGAAIGGSHSNCELKALLGYVLKKKD